MKIRATRLLCATASAASLLAGAALADGPAAPAAPPAAPAAAPMGQPTMGPTLNADPNPPSFDAGPLGKVYVTGAVSGLGMVQTEHSPFDRSNLADISSGLLFIQTTTGPVQFFINAGVYSLPALGTPYVHATTLTSSTYSAIPMAYVKLQPTSTLSIQIGKLPTLIGAEAAYTFQNINIERGLLWNQEPVFSDGVQVNYAKGPVSASVSLNDGFYSNRYNWLSGSFAYTLSPKDSITVAGGGALSKYTRQSAATPVFQNNSDILNLIWTHTEGAWVITPYFQYTHASAIDIGGTDYAGADTYSGAILAKYSFNAHWSLAGRVEYVASSSASCMAGDDECAQTSLLYGPGSKAVSVTLTPTYQKGIFFVRGEASYVGITSGAPGAGFGQDGNARSQFRGLLETGFIF
ncbi:MAG TPA: outer membrane beta-barrel protein [Caulobacteraceae bacterium]